MKMVKERTRTMSAVNDERRQVLSSKVIWDKTIYRFVVFRKNVEGYYEKIGAGYLFDSSFQETKSVDCYVDFHDEVPSAFHLKKNERVLYGALLSVCQNGVGRSFLIENRDKQDGILPWCPWVWCPWVQQHETDVNRNANLT
jgi:hypothetical protein